MKRLLTIQLAFSAVLLLTNCSERKANLRTIVQERVKSSQTNFIPDSAGITPSYWCTWSAQNFAVDTFTLNYVIGLGDHTVPSDNLTEDVVFGNLGWEQHFPREIKKDLFIVFDVGWDIAGGSHADKDHKWILGTQELAPDKFPSCTGIPQERLKKLNELTRKAGWKGAGIWVAAQTAMESKGKKISDQEVEDFFRERFRWSKMAGVKYWKVDYGTMAGDLKFREMLTRVSHEEAPGLWVEHGRGSGPFNDDECPWDSPNYGKTGSYKNWDDGKALKTAHEMLEFGDVLRTYDVSAQLSIPTTLGRVAHILNSFSSTPKGKGIINCEDEPYLAAALGCAIGVMRHPAFIDASGHDYDPLKVKNQMDAITRAVRWQRMAPAFSVGSQKMKLDSLQNNDYWTFTPGQTWANWMTGRTVLQVAPARVARGMQLAGVKCDGPAPYVICSKFPNGNYAVATLIRTDSLKGFIYPLADIVLTCDQLAPIGVFGSYKSLTLEFAAENPIEHVYAQDLAGNSGIEITDLVEKKGKSLIFSGELLKHAGLSSASDKDVSEPGLVLLFK